MKHSCVKMLQVDVYAASILDALSSRPDVLSVEISPEARWRPAGGGEDAPWHEAGDKPYPPAAVAAAAAAAAGGGWVFYLCVRVAA